LPMRLSEFQAGMRDLLLGDYGNLESPPAAFADQVAANAIPLPERLKIYRGNMASNLTAALRTAFPMIDKIVGAEFFDFMARHYILSHPPIEAYLGTYGDQFDTFIAGFKPAENLPYLYDTARFEIALSRAYRAEDDRALDKNDLGKIKPENLPDLKHSSYPLNDLRAFCLAGDEGPAPDLGKGAVFLMIYRPALEVEIVTLAEHEYAFLENISKNNSLGDSLEKTIQDFPDFDIAACLQRHIALGSFQAAG
jgi:hypothetical protein